MLPRSGITLRRSRSGWMSRIAGKRWGGDFGSCKNEDINDRFRNTAEISRLLRAARPSRGPKLVAGAGQRPDAVVHQCGNESVQGYISGGGEARLQSRGDVAEVRAGGRET